MALTLLHPPLPPIDACVIDLDGTLVDTLGDFELALNAMLAALGRAPIDRARIAGLVGKGSEHLIKSVLKATGSAEAATKTEAHEALFQLAWRHYQAAYQRINGQRSACFPGAAEGLARLRALGLPLACLTNKPLTFARPLLAAKGLAGFFAHVFGGDSFARKKPDPLPVLASCRALGTAPGRTLVLGDSSNDAAAARAAGCPVLLLRYGYNHGQPVETVDADGWCDALTEVAAELAAARDRRAAGPAGRP